MRGEAVVIRYKIKTGLDNYNAPVYDRSEQSVLDVLVAPGARSDVTDINRPEGKRVKYTLYFPKGFEGTLEGSEVNIRGSWYKVIGSPDYHTLNNIPTSWFMVAEVEDIHG